MMLSFNLNEKKIHSPNKFPDMKNALTFVTVVFSGEFANLLLQARSLALYGNDAIKQWIIVLNDEVNIEEKKKLFLSIEKEILDAHFPVLWIDRKDMTDFDFSQTEGSRSQQIIKIMISNFIEDDLYVLLDAKNHAIRELKPSFFLMKVILLFTNKNMKIGAHLLDGSLMPLIF
ncbi:hypothetical protein AAJCM20276_35570 (plasmid) [Acetobacter aceti]|uniref:Uncharacterized protein n=1 Tax=Acetobacter aceti TaxID=435 RepID=A0A6S6PNM1_ACEAC|nr:DUF6492 family protein [Acetobacter aceti]BCI68933.1 hypothetical protein AAJCM20276_35570 [Acetobacter aceti]